MDDLQRLTNGQIVPSELLEVIKRMLALYGNTMKVDSVNWDWITVSSPSQTDTNFFNRVILDEKTIFVNGQLERFQVMCAHDPATGRGIKIHYLGHARKEDLPGYWWI